MGLLQVQYVFLHRIYTWLQHLISLPPILSDFAAIKLPVFLNDFLCMYVCGSISICSLCCFTLSETLPDGIAILLAIRVCTFHFLEPAFPGLCSS